MRTRWLPACLALALLVPAGGSDWRQFRGTDNSSVSDETGLPVDFDARSGRDVAWKAPLPGRGPSSPIVVGGRVVVTCSSGPRQDRLHVLCFDDETGKRLWHRQLWATGHTIINSFAAVAAPTPASDGQLVFAFYSSNDLACFDLDGNLRWFRGLAYEHPATRNDSGMGSSPLVVGRTVIVQAENLGDSFAAGFDTQTGETRWHAAREQGATWTSPTLLRGAPADKPLVLLQSRSKLSACDPETGKPAWEWPASCHTIATVAACGGLAYLPANGLHALRFDPASAEVKQLWEQPILRSDKSSPIVHAGRAYTIKPPGILVCGDLAAGEVLWQLRLTGPFWATPVLADGRLYCVNHGGLVQVVELGAEGKLVGKSQIDEGILASPAVADRAIYFRSDAYLWKIKHR